MFFEIKKRKEKKTKIMKQRKNNKIKILLCVTHENACLCETN